MDTTRTRDRERAKKNRWFFFFCNQHTPKWKLSDSNKLFCFILLVCFGRSLSLFGYIVVCRYYQWWLCGSELKCSVLVLSSCISVWVSGCSSSSFSRFFCRLRRIIFLGCFVLLFFCFCCCYCFFHSVFAFLSIVDSMRLALFFLFIHSHQSTDTISRKKHSVHQNSRTKQKKNSTEHTQNRNMYVVYKIIFFSLLVGLFWIWIALSLSFSIQFTHCWCSILVFLICLLFCFRNTISKTNLCVCVFFALAFSCYFSFQSPLVRFSPLVLLRGVSTFSIKLLAIQIYYTFFWEAQIAVTSNNLCEIPFPSATIIFLSIRRSLVRFFFWFIHNDNDIL